MRADQIERMRKIQEDVCEAFFIEGDPKDWPGLESKEDRGDRYWMKKNATASLTIIGRIENLLALRDGRASGGPTQRQASDDEANLEKEIKQAEREARDLAREVVARAAGKRAKARG